LELLTKAVREQPKGTWIRANLSVAIMEDPSADRWAIDKVAPDHPVWLEPYCIHWKSDPLSLFGRCMREHGFITRPNEWRCQHLGIPALAD